MTAKKTAKSIDPTDPPTLQVIAELAQAIAMVNRGEADVSAGNGTDFVILFDDEYVGRTRVLQLLTLPGTV